MNQFEIPAECKLIFVGIRGSLPADVKDTSFKNAQTIILKDVDYRNLRCCFLQWKTDTNEVADVEKAIESIALPVGSYTVKQHSKFNISVNGYVGYAFDLKSGSGIYAPVGLSFNKGLGRNKNYGALSLFFSVLDVGGIVAYRLKDDTTPKLKQDIRLESILSPSAQLLYEIPNWPVTLCAGWRLTPKLIYSSATDFLTVQPKNVINLSVLIDIPLVTILNKTKE